MLHYMKKWDQNLELWYEPPAPKIDGRSPKLEQYFGRRLLVWAPKRQFNLDIACPLCRRHLPNNGL